MKALIFIALLLNSLRAIACEENFVSVHLGAQPIPFDAAIWISSRSLRIETHDGDYVFSYDGNLRHWTLTEASLYRDQSFALKSKNSLPRNNDDVCYLVTNKKIVNVKKAEKAQPIAQVCVDNSRARLAIKLQKEGSLSLNKDIRLLVEASKRNSQFSQKITAINASQQGLGSLTVYSSVDGLRSKQIDPSHASVDLTTGKARVNYACGTKIQKN